MVASSASSRLVSLTEDIYPNLHELSEWIYEAGDVPAPLVCQILERYAEHASEYPSNNEHLDLDTGRTRWDNACLTRNSLQDAIEEIIDAVFNIVIANHKSVKQGKDSRQDIIAIFRLLVEAWRQCSVADGRRVLGVRSGTTGYMVSPERVKSPFPMDVGRNPE